jgi:hypothetical protein
MITPDLYFLLDGQLAPYIVGWLAGALLTDLHLQQQP